MKNHGRLTCAAVTFLALALSGAAGGCAGRLNREPGPAYEAGRRAEAGDKPDRAADLYRRALDADPEHAPSLHRLGTIYTARGDYNRALGYWQRYVDATGGTAEAFNNIGYCYDRAGYLGMAEANYERAIQKDPTFARARVNYGLLLARGGREHEATLQLQQVLTPAEVHYNLARVYEVQGKREKAMVEYRRAVRLDPDFEEAKDRLISLE